MRREYSEYFASSPICKLYSGLVLTFGEYSCKWVVDVSVRVALGGWCVSVKCAGGPELGGAG